MEKFLITGATGLIGATVYQHFVRKSTVIRLGRRKECELQADLSKPETFTDINFDNCKVLIHCAGITDEDIKYRPTKALIQSTSGMNALIQTAVKSGVEKFVYISTSHVYGHQLGIINEDVPANPLSDYAIAHYAAEQVLRRNAEKFKSCTILRPNAVFGLPILIDNFKRWSLIPYSFPLECVYNRKIVLRSSGEQNRNFISTQDIANYIEHIALLNNEGFSIINPLGLETISVYQFALKCAKLYIKLTSEQCIVERPLIQKESAEQEFIYQSNHNLKIAKGNLEAVTEDLMLNIMNKLKNGKKYGS